MKLKSKNKRKTTLWGQELGEGRGGGQAKEETEEL